MQPDRHRLPPSCLSRKVRHCLTDDFARAWTPSECSPSKGRSSFGRAFVQDLLFVNPSTSLHMPASGVRPGSTPGFHLVGLVCVVTPRDRHNSEESMLPQLAFGLWTVVAPGFALASPGPIVVFPSAPSEMSSPASSQVSNIPNAPVRTVPASARGPEQPQPQGNPVPEPATLALVGSGLLALSLAVRKRREEERQKGH